MTRWILKARRIDLISPPSASQVERERSFWGPHPDPGLAQIEASFYQVGFRYLAQLYGAVLGDGAPRAFRKAEGGPAQLAGWGELAKLFNAPADDPSRLVASWRSLADYLSERILPASTVDREATLWALRTALYDRLGSEVMTLDLAGLSREVRSLPSTAKLASEWTKARGMEYLVGVTDTARTEVRRTMLASRLAGHSSGRFQQVLFDRFSDQNRDWRRVAITETAFAANNAKLASVDPAEGWLAEWRGAPNACPFCKRMHGRRFRVVSPDAPRKDGDREIWWGKHNVGRSAHRWSRKLNRERTPAELWWPALPAHPNCACGLVLVRAPRP